MTKARNYCKRKRIPLTKINIKKTRALLFYIEQKEKEIEANKKRRETRLYNAPE